MHNRTSVSILVFTVIILCVYANSLGNDFVSDDLPSLVNHPLIDKPEFLFQRPDIIFKNIVFSITYHLGGMKPVYFRIVSIGFHLLNTIILYLLCRKLPNRPAAFWCALVFAVHPIVTEAVVWISAQEYVQYILFFLISLYLYSSGTGNTYYSLSIFSFILMLATSLKSVPLVLVYPLFDKYILNRRIIWKRISPLLAISGIWIVANLLLFKSAQNRLEYLQDANPDATGLYNPLIQIPAAFSSYIHLFLFPSGLSFYHSDFNYKIPELVIRTAITFLFFALWIFSFFRNHIQFFWYSFLIISLLPFITPLKLAWIVAERYVYPGTMALSVIMINYLYKYLGQKSVKSLLPILLTVYVFILSTRTVIRNNDWKSQDNLWIATAKTQPLEPRVHNNLGDMYTRRQKYDKAISEFTNAVNLNPSYAEAYHNLGRTYYLTGDNRNAVSNLNRALKINPALWQSCQILAAISYGQKDYGSALKYLDQGINISAQGELYANKALIFLKLNRYPEAHEQIIKALSISPENTYMRKIRTEIEKQLEKLPPQQNDSGQKD